MQLPDQLKAAIEAETAHIPLRDLEEMYANLSKRYQEPYCTNGERRILSQTHRHAYITARMPATYAAIYRVLQEIHLLYPTMNIHSLLDLGAGPGTVMWAAADLIPTLTHITLLEQDSELIAMGKRLAKHALSSTLQQASWQQKDLHSMQDLAPHDLSIFSYSFGELCHNPPQSIQTEKPHPALEKVWQHTQQLLIIIEPGTPSGFQRILEARNALIAMGGYVVAPCPHAHACPIQHPDWCHFSQRIERSASHRRVKQAQIGHEDEKFSYIALSKTPPSPSSARILRHPQKHSGHVALRLCTKDQGIQALNVSRKDKELYRLARKAEWGDGMNISNTH